MRRANRLMVSSLPWKKLSLNGLARTYVPATRKLLRSRSTQPYAYRAQA